MKPLRLSARARADLRGIWNDIVVKSSNPAAADRLIDRLQDALRVLAERPLLGQARDDLRAGIRTFVVGKYVLLYYPAKHGIRVAGIVHGAQDIEGIFRRGER